MSGTATPQYPRPVLPRLSFSGTFFTDPSTVNNTALHYNSNTFRPSYQEFRNETSANGWNPEGMGTFVLADCAVTAVHNTGSTSDTLLDTKVFSNDSNVAAKIADIDPSDQFISMIFGLRFTLTDNLRLPGSTRKPGAAMPAKMTGVMKPAYFRDLNTLIPENPNGLENASAVYQNVIVLDEELNVGNSAFLSQCQYYITESKEMFPEHGALSVCFRVSGYNSDRTSPYFNYGNIVGYIQPWLKHYPLGFDASRILYRSPGYFAYAELQQATETTENLSIKLNLMSSFTKSASEELNVGGSMHLGYRKDNGFIKDLGKVHLGRNDATWLGETAAVFEIPISSDERSELESSPLVLFHPLNNKIYLREDNGGLYCRPDEAVRRVDCEEENVIIDVYASTFGQRVQPGTEIQVKLTSGWPTDKIRINGITPPATDPDFENQGSIMGQLDTVITTVTSDSEKAQVHVENLGPGRPRQFIEGEVYKLGFGIDGYPRDPTKLNDTASAHFLFFDEVAASDRPSWLGNILPILKPYANLYPSMNRVLQLDNYGSVIERKQILKKVFSLPFEDPGYMPVTRDLSTKKRQMLLQWLEGPDYPPENLPDIVSNDDPLYMNIKNVDDLEVALQTALELEHATIPPYLTALFSIKPGYNKYVSDAIKDVVMEEMLHFALVANTMIALGMKPKINNISFVPKYPGTLPGGLRQDLTVRLRKCSIDQIKMFMDIESPEVQILDVNNTLATGPVPLEIGNGTKPPMKSSTEGILLKNRQRNRFTIGFLYDMIMMSLKALTDSNKIHFPDSDIDPSNAEKRIHDQVEMPNMFNGKLTKIHNLEDAINALRTIKEEGEGASAIDFTDEDTDPKTGLPELAHYYRFAEIVKGKRLVKRGNNYSYSGPNIDFDPEGVFNMQDDPNLTNLPPGGERTTLEAFANKYQAMLNGLHKAFNGEPESMQKAVSAMFQLTMSARRLMEMPLPGPNPDKKTVGISFQVPPGALESL